MNIKITTLITIIFFKSLNMTHTLSAQAELDQGNLIINTINDSITSSEKKINDIIAQTEDIKRILDKITDIQAKISQSQPSIAALENQKTALQSQIDQASQGIYRKAIDPSDGKNMYDKINGILNSIIDNNQDDLNQIIVLEQQVAEKIINQIEQIQALGIALNSVNKESQAQYNQIYLQLYSIQSQLNTAKNSAIPLITLENKLIDYLSQLDNIIDNIDSDNLIKITKLQVKKNQKKAILKMLRSPESVIQITPNQLELFK